MSDDVNVKIRQFFDSVIEERKFKNDAALCRALDLFPPILSKVAHNKMTFGPTLILRFHEKLGIPVKKIRAAIGENGNG